LARNVAEELAAPGSRDELRHKGFALYGKVLPWLLVADSFVAPG